MNEVRRYRISTVVLGSLSYGHWKQQKSDDFANVRRSPPGASLKLKFNLYSHKISVCKGVFLMLLFSDIQPWHQPSDFCLPKTFSRLRILFFYQKKNTTAHIDSPIPRRRSSEFYFTTFFGSVTKMNLNTSFAFFFCYPNQRQILTGINSHGTTTKKRRRRHSRCSIKVNHLSPYPASLSFPVKRQKEFRRHPEQFISNLLSAIDDFLWNRIKAWKMCLPDDPTNVNLPPSQCTNNAFSWCNWRVCYVIAAWQLSSLG